MLLSSLIVSVGPWTAWADQSGTWPVKGKLVSNKGDKSKNVSGIACTRTDKFPRACLVIDDNMQAAQFVTVKDGELRAGDQVPLIDNQFGGEPLELDGEGVAYADGSFYVMGSHGHPRDKKKKLNPTRDAEEISARIAASSQIIRIHIKSTTAAALTKNDILDIQRSSKLRKIIGADPLLNRFLDRRLENNGVTIEGVAVLGDRLFAGFRGPTLENGRSPILSVTLGGLFATEPAEPRLILLPLGEGRGVRDLSPLNDGLLILAGPTGDDAGPYGVYWWNAASGNLHFLADITKATAATAQQKPEAILPLEQGPSGLRVVILSDGSKEGTPRAVLIPSP